jgi:hypothetical protein
MPYSRTAIITFLDGNGGLSPDQGLPSVPGRPDNSLPGMPPYPSQGLPGVPPQAIQLPVFPFDPTTPDNSLPGTPTPTPPPVVWPPRPGNRFVAKWLACVGLILVPDNSLPETPMPEPK